MKKFYTVKNDAHNSQETNHDIFKPSYKSELVLKAQQGDLEAQSSLYEIFQPMIKAIASKRTLQYPEERDDMYGHLSLQFLLLLKKYDQSKDKNFHHYLSLNLTNAAIQLYRNHSREKQRYPLQPDEIMVSYCQQDVNIENVPNRILIRMIMSLLNHAEKDLIYKRYVTKLTLREIAAEENVAVSTVAKRLTKIIVKIKKHIDLPDF